MPQFQHLEVLSRESGPVSRVRLVNRGPFGTEEIAEMSREWNVIADHPECQSLFVDCSKVQVLNSELLSKLILLQRRLVEKGAGLVLCGLHAEVREVLHWTKLDRFFKIESDEKLEPAEVV